MSTASIAALNVYPVKSCGGIPLARARVAVRGLTLEADASVVSDREWMIVDRNGRFVTQRELPRLALVRVSVDEGALRLSLPGVSACDVSLASPVGPKALAEIEESTKQGHGLYTVDGSSDGLEHLVVGISHGQWRRQSLAVEQGRVF